MAKRATFLRGEYAGYQGALDHLDTAVPGQAHDRAAGDAVEEAVRCR